MFDFAVALLTRMKEWPGESATSSRMPPHVKTLFATTLTFALAVIFLSGSGAAGRSGERRKTLQSLLVSATQLLKMAKFWSKVASPARIYTAIVGRVAGSETDYLNGSERLPVGMFTDDMIRAGEEGLVWTQENIAAYSQDPIGFIQEYLDDETARPNMSVKLKKGADDIAAYLATFTE